jgi:hypothetical protein
MAHPNIKAPNHPHRSVQVLEEPNDLAAVAKRIVKGGLTGFPGCTPGDQEVSPSEELDLFVRLLSLIWCA